MNEIVEYSFVSWFQFFIVGGVGLLTLLVADRFHLFKRHSWKTSIGYHMFFCFIMSIITIVFLAVHPVFHLILLLVVFGFIYKNIFAYIVSIFNLYFSKIHMGDRIRIGDTTGVLTNINLGGMHISSHNEKTFYPFNNWKGDKIVLLSEAGKVALALFIKDEENRTVQESIYALEKNLFNFPYLANEEISISSQDGDLVLNAMVSTGNMKESIKSNIQRFGFSIKEINN
ncbi:MAG: hypothetical protein ACJA1A_002399 [Saprospiraceae bacterium]|jgi:hypothetical protein|tara:strand:+ start:658 stop:1344 length:687 start_codon:yes stop_codon:yes gene_type:complete